MPIPWNPSSTYSLRSSIGFDSRRHASEVPETSCKMPMMMSLDCDPGAWFVGVVSSDDGDSDTLEPRFRVATIYVMLGSDISLAMDAGERVTVSR